MGRRWSQCRASPADMLLSWSHDAVIPNAEMLVDAKGSDVIGGTIVVKGSPAV